MSVQLRELEWHLALKRTLPPPAERRRLRLDAGVSLERIARAVGVTRQTVALWEAGAEPRPEHLEPYLDALRLCAGDAP